MALAIVTVAVYAPVQRFQFVTYDDPWFITENTAVTGGLTWSGVRWAWKNAYLATGGPLTWLSHMADVEMFGLAPGWHHITNLAWHLVNTLLLFGVLTRMTRRLTASALVAALFAVHPLHVESVAWVAQRKDILSTFFWLLAMWAYDSYSRRPRAGSYGAVMALHTCGLLAKPMVATLPFVLLLLDVWPLGRLQIGNTDWPRLRRLVVEKLPLLALSLLSLWGALQAQRQIGAVVEYGGPPLATRMANATVSYVAYIRMFFWPSGLVPHYPYEMSIPAWIVLVCLLLLTGATLAALAIVRRVPAVAVGWAWYLGALIPTIGLVQVGGHRMADRFTYVPSIGFFIMLVWGLAETLPVRRLSRVAVGGVALAIVTALAVAARAQVWVWQDGLTLWQHTVRVSPGNATAQANLGASLFQAGRFAEAVTAYYASLQIDPGNPKVHYNLGLVLARLGDRTVAHTELTEAIRLNPRYAAAHASLAALLADAGDIETAIRHYDEAIRLDATAGLPRINLAMALARDGRLADALPHALAAVELEPTRTDWRLALAHLYEDLGRREDAIRELQTVLQLTPNHEEAMRDLAALSRR